MCWIFFSQSMLDFYLGEQENKQIIRFMRSFDVPMKPKLSNENPKKRGLKIQLKQIRIHVMNVKIVTKNNEKSTHEKMSNILPYNKDSLS